MPLAGVGKMQANEYGRINMSAQPTENTSDKLKNKPSDNAGKSKDVKERPWDQRADDTQRNYGFSQGAELNTAGEETERQEYTADGLPRTQTYSVDKVGRAHDDHNGPDSKHGDR